MGVKKLEPEPEEGMVPRGEVVQFPAEPNATALPGYDGAGLIDLTKEQTEALCERFADDEHEVKPTDFGEVYASHVHMRRRLNLVLGAGQWALVPIARNGSPYSKDRDTICYHGRLYVKGKYKAEAVGEQAIASDRMTYASACEAARSDCLVRCCKDLSVGWECWDRHWTEGWKKRFAVRVAYRRKGELKYGWRRKDAEPLYGEVPIGSARQAAEDSVPSPALVSKKQAADLWAVATEKIGRQKAEGVVREILKAHGFKSFHEITAAKYQAVLKDVKKAGA